MCPTGWSNNNTNVGFKLPLYEHFLYSTCSLLLANEVTDYEHFRYTPHTRVHFYYDR